MGKKLVETMMGALVLAVAGLFAVFAYTTSNVRTVRGYEVVAHFERVDGVAKGSDVKIAGIKVGSVIEQRLDPVTFEAVLRMSIDPAIKLPTDSSAAISSDGLLGTSYIALTPGGDDKNLEPGGRISITQSTVNIVQLIGKYIFGSEGAQSGEKDKPSAPAPR